MGVVDGQSTIRLPGLSGQPAEKKKTEDKKATSSKPVKPVKSSKSSSHRPSTDHKSLTSLLSRSHPLMAHPANVVRTEPFLKPADQPSSQHTDSSASAATDPPSSKHKATEKSVSDLSQASH